MPYTGNQSIIYASGTGVNAVQQPTTYGNGLEYPSMEPNWTLETDTFGLVQSTVNFKQDLTFFLSANGILNFPRGMPHPVLSSYLFLHKASASIEKGNIVNITANYCGIDPEMSDGYTIPIVSMVGSSSAEDITHHPNFIKKNCTSIADGEVLAGEPPAAPYTFNDDLELNPNRALWTAAAQNGGLVSQPQFVAFLPPDTPTGINIKAGVRSYYKPQITLRLTMYVGGGSDSSTAEANAGKLASYNGWITKGTTFKLPDAYKKLAIDGAYAGNFTYSSDYNGYVNRSFLVTNVSMELFGNIYKVTADLMLSGINGWDKDIYPSIPGETS